MYYIPGDVKPRSPDIIPSGGLSSKHQILYHDVRERRGGRDGEVRGRKERRERGGGGEERQRKERERW